MESTAREYLLRQGSKRVHGLAHNLHATLKTVRQLLADDVTHAEEWQILQNEYEQLSKRAATVVFGAARNELHKYVKYFNALDLYGCWTNDQIKSCRSDARRWVAFIEKLVSKAESISDRLPQVRHTYEQIDRGVVVGDAEANAKYIATTKALEEIQNAFSQGELDRAATLLRTAESSLVALRLHVDREANNAAEELAMWLKVATLSPNTMETFKSELHSMSGRPTGDHLQLWLSLRRRIETGVWKSAGQRRAANAAVLIHPALKCKLGEQRQELMLEFVKMSLQALKDATNIK
jgi:hypothetical protein